MRDLEISEVSARSPDMSESEFAELVADIQANGQLVPIVLRNGEVIDGRKRLAACTRLGITPKSVNLDPSQDAEAVARGLNLLRTHYTPSQRAMFAAGRANATKSDGGKMRQGSMSEFQLAETVSARQAAHEVGVHHTAVLQAKKIARDAAPEVTEAVRSGKLTLHAATQITQIVPVDEQREAVAKVIEANRGKPRNTPIAKVLHNIEPRRDRPNPRVGVEQFALAIDKLEVGAEIVAQYADAATSDIRRTDFAESLRRIRAALTKVINTLEIAA